MTKPIWLLVVSPSILCVVALVAGVVPPGYTGVYSAFAILQVMFLVAAFERVRLAYQKQRGGRVVMPMWQKVVLAIACAYGLLLVIVGALTKQ